MKPLLNVHELHVYYGPIHAVKGISFMVLEGEIVSLIGSNGAGKTTILRAISGLVSASGRVEFLGANVQNILDLPVHERVRVGIAQSPEGRGVFPNLSVTENLELGAFHRNNRQERQSDLEMCFSTFPRLRERKNQLAGTLSGGEQQMVAISRALMARPRLLLLDEPSLGLAPLIVKQIFDIIVELNKRGTTILLVEQNAHLALKISNRAYVLETGSISVSGFGSDLLSNDDVRRTYLGM